MKAHTVSLINSLVLVTMGLWGYLDSDSRPITALIPVIVGIVLLIINSGVKKENKIAAHIAVLLTLLIIIGLVRPFFRDFRKGKYYWNFKSISNDFNFIMGNDYIYSKFYFSEKK